MFIRVFKFKFACANAISLFRRTIFFIKERRLWCECGKKIIVIKCFVKIVSSFAFRANTKSICVLNDEPDRTNKHALEHKNAKLPNWNLKFNTVIWAWEMKRFNFSYNITQLYELSHAVSIIWFECHAPCTRHIAISFASFAIDSDHSVELEFELLYYFVKMHVRNNNRNNACICLG